MSRSVKLSFYVAKCVLLLFLVLGLASSCGTRKRKTPIRRPIAQEGDFNRIANAYDEAHYEPLNYSEKPAMRAVWLTTIYGLDWPKTRGNSYARTKQQQDELVAILDELQRMGFNTVFLQVRLRGDLLYPSSIEPQSDILTGHRLQKPTYDPLAFAIAECHKRGLALHAWLVTYPLGNKSQVEKLGARGVAKRHPSWVVFHKGEYYLNPGLPEVRGYLVALVEDLVSRYPVDGIHFDYIRYPDGASSFKDDKEYKKYRRLGQSKASWREENINRLLRSVAVSVRRIRPCVLISAAPLGRYRDIPGEKATGWNAKGAVHQDPKVWFDEGSVDFIVPMMYYRDNLFDPYLQDWKSQMGNGIVIPGLGAYRTEDKSQWSPSTIVKQLQLVKAEGLAGVCFYRQANITRRNLVLHNSIVQQFEFPVRPLPFYQRAVAHPGKPYFRRCEILNEELVLTWEPASENDGTAYYNLFFNLYDRQGRPQEDYLLRAMIRSKELRLPLAIFPKKGIVHLRLEAANSLNQIGRASKPLVIDLKRRAFLD